MSLFLLLLVCILCVSAVAQEVLYEWTQLDYTWDATHERAKYIASEQFIPENCLLAGINVDTNGDVYLTVPRWRPGVPATLNKLDVVTKTLTPFPGWDVQEEGVTGDLQNVQSMTIDSQRRMWTIEVGRRNFFDGKNAVAGAAGLWIINMDSGAVELRYSFPEEVVSSTDSFLNDLVLDETRGLAYLTDAWGDGGIITFDLANLASWRYSGPTTKNDPNYNMIINGHFYGKRIFTTPTDGIAITSDAEAIFYCQVQGTTLYRLSTQLLRNSTAASADIDAAVQTLGTKQPSDGMKYAPSSGELYWGSLPTSTVYKLKVDAFSFPDMEKEAAQAVEINEETMEWVDTFALGPNNQLYYTSNRLDQYSVHSMDFSGSAGANMRILRLNL